MTVLPNYLRQGKYLLSTISFAKYTYDSPTIRTIDQESSLQLTILKSVCISLYANLTASHQNVVVQRIQRNRMIMTRGDFAL